MPYKDPLKEKEYHKKYQETHRKEFSAYNKKYFSKPDVKAHRRAYLKKHPWKMKDTYRVARRLWNERNKIRRAAEYKIYCKNNPMIIRAKEHRRLARLRQAKGILTVELLQRIYEDNIKLYGTLTCYLCLTKIAFGKDHLEHKTPLSRGGSNYYSNLSVSCQRCNLSKKNKTEEEYRKYLEKLNANILSS